MYVEACSRSNTLNAMHVEGVKRVCVNSKNVFTSVCHSVHRKEGPLETGSLHGGGYIHGVCIRGSAPGGGGPPPRASASRDVRLAGSARGSVCRRIYIKGGVGAVADPGFPQGGDANSPGGRQHTNLPNFPKNCMKLKEFGPPGGAHPSCPLRSATGGYTSNLGGKTPAPHPWRI